MKRLLSKTVLFDIDYTLFNTDIFKQAQLKKHSVYSEVRNVLIQLSKIAKLGIFSEGDLNLQKTKLLKTDIHKYFSKEHIHIVPKKDEIIEKILQKYKNTTVFLVDDKLTILHQAKTIRPSLFTIWVKRGKYAKNQKPLKGFVPDAIIESLNELIPVINSLN